MNESLIIGCLGILWGITSFIIFNGLEKGMGNPDSKWWNFIGFHKKGSLFPVLWIAFIVLGFVAGILGLATVGVSFT